MGRYRVGLARACAITAAAVCWLSTAPRPLAALAIPHAEAQSRIKEPGAGADQGSHSSPPLDPYRTFSRVHRAAMLTALPQGLIEALTEQSPAERTRSLQIGLHRPFDHPLEVNAATAGRDQWTLLTNGWHILSLYVASPNAVGMRLHFEKINLPHGGRIVIYDPAYPSTTSFDLDTSSVSSEIWAPTIFSDQVSIECQLPPGIDSEKASFSISGVSHIYRPPIQANVLKEGSCEVDVSCYSEYSQEARGVALIAYVANGNTYMCSGCLLATTRPTAAEYFLTARHCIGGQGLASTLEFYWLFQTSGCNGTPPAINGVPTTKGGADLLAVGISDFSLLRLHQAAPGGVSYLGWSINRPGTGETLACVHHPDGAYKRIAVGTYYDSDANFWAAQWSTGVTEGGSSGAPLLNAAHQVIGQLNGGFNGPGSSCSDASAPDQFGRFDVTYPHIQKWIDPIGSSGPSTIAGTYYGLFQDQSVGVVPDSSGAFTVTTTAKGKLSGRIRMGAASWPFTGALDINGVANVTMNRGNLNPLSMQLNIDLSQDAESLAGLITDGNWTATMTGNRAVFTAGSTASGQMGRYTLIVPPSDGTPPGTGYGAANVARNGRLTYVGSLTDGTKVSQSTFVSQGGFWPLYVPLYAGKGYLFSWVNFTPTSANDLSGELYWYKSLANGFSTVSSLSGSYYTPPGQGNALLNFTDGVIALSGGNLSGTLEGEIWLHPDGHVTNRSRVRLNLVFSPATGTFNGSVVDPDTNRPLPVHGVALQKGNMASGFFLDRGQSGQVTVEP